MLMAMSMLSARRMPAPVEYAAAVERYLGQASLGPASRRVYRISLAAWAWPLVSRRAPLGERRRGAVPPVVPLALLDDPSAAAKLAAALADRAVGAGARTVNRELSALRSAVGWWLDQRWIRADPTAGLYHLATAGPRPPARFSDWTSAASTWPGTGPAARRDPGRRPGWTGGRAPPSCCAGCWRGGPRDPSSSPAATPPRDPIPRTPAPSPAGPGCPTAGPWRSSLRPPARWTRPAGAGRCTSSAWQGRTPQPGRGDPSAEEDLGLGVAFRRDQLELAGRLGDRDMDDLRTVQRHHHAERAVVHRVDGVDPEPRRQHPVECRWGAAALDVPEHRGPRLLAGALLDLVGEDLPDPTEADMAERVEPLVRQGQVVFLLRPRALGDHDQRRVAVLEPVFHVRADPLHAERPFRDQDHVGAAGHPRVQRDPAGVPPHHLDDQRAVMALRGGVQPVDGLHRDVHRGVEPERVVGGAEVVVDGLGYPHDRHALGVQARGHPEGVLAADRHQCLNPEAGEVCLDPLQPGPAARRRVLGQRVGSGGAKYRPAARQDAPDRLDVQRDRVALQRPAPAVAEAQKLISVLRDAPPD